MKSLAKLIHSDMMLIALERAKSKHEAPAHNFESQKSAKFSNEKLREADSLFLRIATIEEYKLLEIEICNSLSYLFAGYKKCGKIARNFRPFWKYYINLIRANNTKEFKKDAAIYAYLSTLVENDHNNTLCCTYRPDVSFKPIQIPFNSLGRRITKVDREHFELLSSSINFEDKSTGYERQSVLENVPVRFHRTVKSA